MEIKELIYDGKTKQLYATNDPQQVVVRYKDAATAFNAIKRATIEHKGLLS